MFKISNIAAVVALAGAAALPGCSMFGGGNNGQASNGYASQSYASAQPNYSSAPAAQQATELTPHMIRRVQQALQQDGTYHANIDGVWGPATQAAVRDYQQQHNMNATGELDQQTLASLNLGTGSQQSSATQAPQTQQSANAQQPPNSYNPPPSNNNQPNTNNTR